MREQFRFTPAEELYGPKRKLIVFRLLLDLFNLNHEEFHHDCTSKSCLREAQYLNLPLDVTASPVTYCVELMKDEVDGSLPVYVQRGLGLKLNLVFTRSCIFVRYGGELLPIKCHH